MIPTKTIEELIAKHSSLEKELSSGELDKKLFAEKSKEYSDINEIIDTAKKYISFENDKKELEKILNDQASDAELKKMAFDVALNDLHEVYKTFEEPQPILEYAFNYLAKNSPKDSHNVLVHGDYRLGNFIISEDEGIKFSKISGDYNPIHLDEVFARKSIPGQIVVHGVNTLLWALENFSKTHKRKIKSYNS